jgi:hypothetical protein
LFFALSKTRGGQLVEKVLELRCFRNAIGSRQTQLRTSSSREPRQEHRSTRSGSAFVMLVWLYLEILRLLSKLRARE